MSRTDETLHDAPRCVLAVSGADGPLLAPVAFWFDGAGLWATLPASADETMALRRGAACAVYVPAGRPQTPDLVIDGRARVHSLADPLRLALHAPMLSAAVVALAVKNAGALATSVRDLTPPPRHWLPANRAAVRVTVHQTRGVHRPKPGPGVAPALPSAVPPTVRRAISGSRHVVVAAGQAGAMRLQPGVWSAGFALTTADGQPLAAGTPVAVAPTDETLTAPAAPSRSCGLILSGAMDRDGRLVPDHVTWWRGWERRSVPLPAAPAGGVELPD